jgi:RNA polymerase sigma factor (sigma-70 family)
MIRGEAGGQKRSPALLTVVTPGPGKEPGRLASSRSSARSPRPIKLLNRVLPLRPLSALPDDRLLELTRAGSERAFEALAIRHRRQLLIYAERMLGAENRAEDAVQQALLQAWMALRGGADVRETRPWLYRIVHNCAVSIIRRPRHDTVELSEQLDAAAAEPGHESRLVLGEIFASLASMPEPQRDAIVMTAIAGRSHEEAAAALGLTDGAVRGLVYRARSALRHAAAAVFPAGLWNWLGRRQPLGGDVADATGVAGAAGSAGLAAAVVKGGAIMATAGVIAGAGPGLLNTAGPPPHSSRAAHHSFASVPTTPSVVTRALNGRPRATPAGAMGISIVIHHGGGNHDRHSRGSGERRGGSGQSGSARRREAEHHSGGSQDSGGSGRGPGPSSNGGSGDAGTSGSSGGSGSSGTSGGDGGDGGGQRSSGGGSSGSLDGSGKSGSDGGSSGGPSVNTASTSSPAPTGTGTSDGGGSTSDGGSSTSASTSGTTTSGSGSSTSVSGSTSDGGSSSTSSGTSGGSGDTVSGSDGGGGS